MLKCLDRIYNSSNHQFVITEKRKKILPEGLEHDCRRSYNLWDEERESKDPEKKIIKDQKRMDSKLPFLYFLSETFSRFR